MRNLITLLGIIFAILLLLNSCKTCPELITSSVTTNKIDSSWQKTKVIHDTSYVSVPGPTIVIPGPCDSLCDKNGKLKSFHQESKKNGIKGSITTNTVNNTLNVDCNEDSLIKVNTTLVIENNRLIKESKVTKDTVLLPCPKDHTTWFDKLCRWWFWITISFAGGFVFFKFGPKLLKFF